jgi:hypothetical protein
MKLDANIYGHDDNGCAASAANDALTQVPVDAEGRAISQAAQSRSAKDTLRLAETQTVKEKNVGGGSDSRARSEGQHGKQG